MQRCVFLLASIVCLLTLPALAQAQAREINPRHYRIHTDLDADLSGDLGRRMDAMYEQYAQRLAVFKGAAALPRLEVYLFRHQRDYMRFTGWRLKNSGGVFLPSRGLLAAFLEGQGRDQLRRTLQHEAFHQFAFNAISPDLPIWLNEGLAQFFEEGLWNGDGFLLGEMPPRRIRQLQADLKAGRLVAFRKLLLMSGSEWAGRLGANHSVGATQYNQSWAMVHFLVMAQNARGEYLYRARLIEMLRLLHDGKDADDAFQLAFGTNVRGFQDRFLDYARALQPSPEPTLIENQGVIADLLIDFARDGHRFDDIASLRQCVTQGNFHLHYSHGDLEWDTQKDMNVYFSDLNGKPFDSDQLFLSVRTGAPVPDLVCRCGNQIVLRTRFFDAEDNAVEHELLIEPLRSSASISN